MTYNWAGDVITRDTVVPDKRIVTGYPKKFIPTDIREWIKAPPNNKLSEALSEIKELPNTKEAGSFDKRAMLIWDYVAKRIRYVYDKNAHKLPDFWMVPEETLSIKRGDCEDSALLLCSLLLASGISPFCVRAALGTIYNEKDKLIGGHAWPIYLDEGGDWRILEATLDKIPDTMPMADELTRGKLKFRYLPSLCFNQYHLWHIGSSSLNLEGYIQFREVKANIRLISNKKRS